MCQKMTKKKSGSKGLTAKYFIGLVTMFFANNYLIEYWITVEFLENFF